MKIRSGYGNLDDEAYNVKFQTAIERFLDNKNLKRNYQLGRLRFYRDDSHAKLFIVDDEYYVLSSMNFLSYKGSGSVYNGQSRDKWEEIGEKSKNKRNLNIYREKFFDF